MPHRSENSAEQEHREDEDPHGAEALRQPARQRHRDRLGDRVGGDHPGALGGAGPERPGDVRHGDVRDRHVETATKLARARTMPADPEHAPLQGGLLGGR